MNILTLVLQAAPQQAPAGGGMSIWIMLALMFVVMWFFMIRPQRKQQKKIESFRNGLQVGQEVVTSGGIYGKIKSMENGIVMLEVAHNVVVRVDISVIYPSSADAQQEVK